MFLMYKSDPADLPGCFVISCSRDNVINDYLSKPASHAAHCF